MKQVRLLITLMFSSIIITSAYAENDLANKLVTAALERTEHTVRYDGSYLSIPYPMGDVPAHMGVCTDVVVRAYRKLDIDLQQLVHEDMKENFGLYPKIWGLKKPDTNIDHRRVPNLKVFFKRFGKELAITENSEDYQPGELVTWNVKRIGHLRKSYIPHIGIVVNQKSKDGKRYMIVHNIGQGPKLEDILFDYPITGHFRYLPESG